MAGEERAMARELERELNSMRAYLEEKESALVKTAELGKALLRENGVLEERLVEANGEATQRIEVQVITANSRFKLCVLCSMVLYCFNLQYACVSLLGNSLSLSLPPSLSPSLPGAGAGEVLLAAETGVSEGSAAGSAARDRLSQN